MCNFIRIPRALVYVVRHCIALDVRIAGSPHVLNSSSIIIYNFPATYPNDFASLLNLPRNFSNRILVNTSRSRRSVMSHACMIDELMDF